MTTLLRRAPTFTKRLFTTTSRLSTTMSTHAHPTDLPIHAFPTLPSFTTFLAQNHTTSPGIWLRFAKKSSGLPSITSDEALDAALCYGWINGQGKPYDDDWYLARYTPRRPNSLWSARNVAKVEKLAEEGRMEHAGRAAVDAAKRDGRWERAYKGPKEIDVPRDLEDALGESKVARRVFEGLNREHRYAVLWRVHTAATEKNRVQRIQRLVEGLGEGRVPGRPGRVEVTDEEDGLGESKEESDAEKATSAAKGRKRAVSAQAGDDGLAKTPRRSGLRPRS